MLQLKKQENFRISEAKKIGKQVKQISSSNQSLPENVSSSSTIITSNSSTQIETQTQLDQEQKKYQQRLNDFLPIRIGDLWIKKLTWRDFPGKPDTAMCFQAHIYWNITYSYTIEQNQKNQNIDYKVRNMIINVLIGKKSWVKKQTEYLLSHEQGHYIIGSLCALDFKQQIMKKHFNSDYQDEILSIFNQTMKYYTCMEIKYDNETNHSKHFEKQTQWFIFLYDQLNKYQEYFDKNFTVQPQNLLKKNNDSKENHPHQLIQPLEKLQQQILSKQKSSEAKNLFQIIQNTNSFQKQQIRLSKLGQIH